MRLLCMNESGHISLVGDFSEDIPPYAILSHTWGSDKDEVSFHDVRTGSAAMKTGFLKIRFCGQQAARDGLRHFWVDTCCIDKSNSTELAEAINSMFSWYKNATKCYAWLEDIPIAVGSSWEEAFENSRWFTRGWTLQELIAPPSVEFFARETRLGDRVSLEQLISRTTGIALSALRGSKLSLFGVTERLSWAARRTTKKPEDKAYSLLGIFGVHMPLIYGEGYLNAFRRLQDAIEQYDLDKRSNSLNSNKRSARMSLESLISKQQKIQNDLAVILNALQEKGMAVDLSKRNDCTVIAGDVVDASQAMETVLQSNTELYEGVQRFLTEENGQVQNFQWFKFQVEKVWADAQRRTASQCRKNKRRRLDKQGRKVGSRHQDEAQDMSDDERHGSQSGLTRQINTINRGRKFAVQQRSLEMNSSTGRVQMSFTSSKQSGELLNARVLYIPTAYVQPNIKGLVLSCAQGLLPHRIERTLSTFQVHPRSSGLLRSIEIGDLEGIKGYFSTRKAHPNDRDEDGDSLLMVSIVHKRYEISKLLLEEGADPHDCNSAGNSALCCLFDEIAGTAEGTQVEDLNSEAIDLALRLFINACGSETGVVLEHYTDLGQSSGESFIPVTHYAMHMFSDSKAQSHLFDPMRRLLLTGDCNLEEEDGFGRSALLACVEGVRRRHLTEMIEMFLHFGANPYAIDNGSAGILHFILRTTSACNRAHSQRSLSLPIKDMLVKLLSRGCDPNSMDQDGTTPSDLALSSSAWQIWCDALNESGLDPKEVIKKDDRQHRLRISTTQINQRYKKWTKRTSSTGQPILGSTMIDNTPHPTCSYCELPGEWIPMKPPFDHYGSYLVKMGNEFAHAAFPNHADGCFCANGLELNTCKRKSHSKDGDYPRWCPREISIRKHVAYRLWKERLLFSSGQAYGWASGSLDAFQKRALPCEDKTYD